MQGGGQRRLSPRRDVLGRRRVGRGEAAPVQDARPGVEPQDRRRRPPRRMAARASPPTRGRSSPGRAEGSSTSASTAIASPRRSRPIAWRIHAHVHATGRCAPLAPPRCSRQRRGRVRPYPRAQRRCQRYHGNAVGKGRQAAKNEIEKLELGKMTCVEAVKHVADHLAPRTTRRTRSLSASPAGSATLSGGGSKRVRGDPRRRSSSPRPRSGRRHGRVGAKRRERRRRKETRGQEETRASRIFIEKKRPSPCPLPLAPAPAPCLYGLVLASKRPPAPPPLVLRRPSRSRHTGHASLHRQPPADARGVEPAPARGERPHHAPTAYDSKHTQHREEDPSSAKNSAFFFRPRPRDRASRASASGCAPPRRATWGARPCAPPNRSRSSSYVALSSRDAVRIVENLVSRDASDEGSEAEDVRRRADPPRRRADPRGGERTPRGGASGRCDRRSGHPLAVAAAAYAGWATRALAPAASLPRRRVRTRRLRDAAARDELAQDRLTSPSTSASSSENEGDFPAPPAPRPPARSSSASSASSSSDRRLGARARLFAPHALRALRRCWPSASRLSGLPVGHGARDGVSVEEEPREVERLDGDGSAATAPDAGFAPRRVGCARRHRARHRARARAGEAKTLNRVPLNTYVAGATAQWRSLRRKSSQEEGGGERTLRRRWVVDDGDGEEDAFPEAGARAGWGGGFGGRGRDEARGRGGKVCATRRRTSRTSARPR